MTPVAGAAVTRLAGDDGLVPAFGNSVAVAGPMRILPAGWTGEPVQQFLG